MSDLSVVFVWLVFLAVPAAMYFYMRARRKKSASRLEVVGEVQSGDLEAYDTTPPPVGPVARDGYVLLERFDSRHGYSIENLEQMIAILRADGIEGFYDFRGVITTGGGDFELWAEKDKADLAIEVLREKYFNI